MPYLSLKKLMVDKFNSSGGHGYFDTQCSIANLAFFFFKKSTTLSISSSVDMPVEMIIGFFVEAIKSKATKSKMSPEPTFHNSTPSSFNFTAAPLLIGVEKKTMPSLSQYALSGFQNLSVGVASSFLLTHVDVQLFILNIVRLELYRVRSGFMRGPY